MFTESAFFFAWRSILQKKSHRKLFFLFFYETTFYRRNIYFIDCIGFSWFFVWVSSVYFSTPTP